MQIYPGLPPYTDTSGKGKIRIGTDCQPLTGTLRRRVMVETGETDYTAADIPEKIDNLISPSAMEQLREAASRERVSDDLLQLNDLDLLTAIGVVHKNRMTRAGLLLAGKRRSNPRIRSRVRLDAPAGCRTIQITVIAWMDGMHSYCSSTDHGPDHGRQPDHYGSARVVSFRIPVLSRNCAT